MPIVYRTRRSVSYEQETNRYRVERERECGQSIKGQVDHLIVHIGFY